MLTIGRKLKQLRIIARKRHRDLAKATDRTEAQICRIENCHSEPRFSTMIKLADYIGVPLEALRDDKDYTAAEVEKMLFDYCDRAATGDDFARRMIVRTARWWGFMLRIGDAEAKEATAAVSDFERSG